MKKLLIFFFVIFTFAFYVVYQRSKVAVVTVSAPQTRQMNAVENVTVSPPVTAVPEKKAVLGQPRQIPVVVPVITPPPPPPAPKPRGLYVDGDYVGTSADAYYGNVQVKAIISNGKIADVQWLDHPQDRQTSQYINDQAMPALTQEAIQAQSANVDTISGATDTSMAFRQSLMSALVQAKN